MKEENAKKSIVVQVVSVRCVCCMNSRAAAGRGWAVVAHASTLTVRCAACAKIKDTKKLKKMSLKQRRTIMKTDVLAPTVRII
jgi:hypothetical protein